MKITKLLAWGFCCIYVCVCPAIKASTIMDTTSNKQRVLSFYKLIVGQRKTELIPGFVREDYIQHNPMVKQGRAGITDVVNYLKTLPPPPVTAKSPIIRAIQEGDLVVTHLDIAFMGKRMAVIDLFRLKDGMLAEHWDVIQDMPDQTRQAITATNGTSEIDESASAINSKKVVELFYKAVINKKSLSVISQFIKKDYIEHDPEVINSGKSLIDYLTSMPDREIKIHRMVSEGNFVMVQSEYRRIDKFYALYEIFRIEGNKIAERWSVEQVLPDGVEVGRVF
jgi:predicted SnoaL-like aldol condensation-catalyzing enzyme